MEVKPIKIKKDPKDMREKAKNTLSEVREKFDDNTICKRCK